MFSCLILTGGHLSERTAILNLCHILIMWHMFFASGSHRLILNEICLFENTQKPPKRTNNNIKKITTDCTHNNFGIVTFRERFGL